MKTYHLLIGLFFVFNACNGQSTSSNSSAKKIAPYGKFVPIILGIHNEHKEKDSLKIEMINDSGSVAFKHQGGLDGWGMRMTEKKIQTGKYKLILSWRKDGKAVKTQKEIVIKPETAFFSLNIELANDPQRRRTFNAIYIDQYSNGLSSVAFKRTWDPQLQFKKGALLIPDYEVTNNNDSTIYGAYLRFSSQLSINWVQPHNIAFMRFEQKTDSGWLSMGCNAPRIEMELKKGATGKTLKDMELGCPVQDFKPGKKYRVRIDYMLNNAIFEKNPAKGEFEDNGYVEQSIFMFLDEFEIK